MYRRRWSNTKKFYPKILKSFWFGNGVFEVESKLVQTSHNERKHYCIYDPVNRESLHRIQALNFRWSILEFTGKGMQDLVSCNCLWVNKQVYFYQKSGPLPLEVWLTSMNLCESKGLLSLRGWCYWRHTMHLNLTIHNSENNEVVKII